MALRDSSVMRDQHAPSGSQSGMFSMHLPCSPRSYLEINNHVLAIEPCNSGDLIL